MRRRAEKLPYSTGPALKPPKPYKSEFESSPTQSGAAGHGHGRAGLWHR